MGADEGAIGTGGGALPAAHQGGPPPSAFRGEVAAAPDHTVTVDLPRLRVGLNYPWPFDRHSSYLGSSEPGFGDWVSTLGSNLARVRDDLGVEVVRIFLMGNLASWGTAERRVRVSQSWPFTRLAWDWVFTPPPGLNPRITDQFEAMLRTFQEHRMKVIPSFVDFRAACNVAVRRGASGLRYELWTHQGKREEFFDMLLEPLLDVAVRYADQIFAWEVMNEPIWPTWESIFNPHIDLPMPAGYMRTFLESALLRIQRRVSGSRRAFRTTVGHRFLEDMDDFPTGDVRQFHYYPVTNSPLGFERIDGDLPEFATTGAILGEFSEDPPLPHQPWWSEVPGERGLPAERRVLERLHLIQRKGYRLALIWPTREADEPWDASRHGYRSDPLKLSANAQRAVRLFHAEAST